MRVSRFTIATLALCLIIPIALFSQFKLEVSHEVYKSSDDYISLCDNTGEFEKLVTLDFDFEFPYFGKMYMNIEASSYSDYFLDLSPENTEESFFDVYLNALEWENLGWWDLECISSWGYFYSQKSSEVSCLNFEWKNVGYLVELWGNPDFPVHSFNFQTRFCSNGEISLLFGEADFENMSTFEEGEGFYFFPGLEPQGAITELLMPLDDETFFGLAGTPDSLILYDKTFNFDVFDADFPYWMPVGTRISFVPEGTSNVVSKENWKKVRILPNPVHESLNINFLDNSINRLNMDVKIYSLSGNLIEVYEDFNLQKTSSLDVRNLPSGFYILTLFDKLKGTQYNSKFIKE